MSTQEKRATVDMLDRADLLLISMKGQMLQAQDRAHQRSEPLEVNEELHLAVVMQSVIDNVRSILDEVAQHVILLAEG